MTLKGDARGQIFQQGSFYYVRAVRPRTIKFGRITCVERGTFPFDVVTHGDFRRSATPPSQGGGVEPQRPQFWGSPLYLCLDPLTQNDRVRHVGMRRVSWGQPRLPSQGAELQRAPILGFPLTLRRRKTEFGEVTHRWEGLFNRPTTPSIPTLRDMTQRTPNFAGSLLCVHCLT